MSRGLWSSLSYNGEHTVWFLLLSILFPVVNSLLCPTCDTQECSPISNCAGGTVTDACGCCLECARLINNTCGGQYQSEGRCDEGLVCVIEPVEGSIITGHEIGICTNIQSDDPSDDRQSLSCDNVDCAIVTQPVHCPSDSVLANYPVSMDSCCPPGQFCKCLPCLSSHHQQCGPDQLPVLKTEGQSLPGNCCDIYECIDRAVFCQHVKCDYDDIFNETCPDDSFLLPSLLSPDGCCFIHQGCACKRKESCQDDDDCPSGLQKRVRKLATGYPGSCCDKSDCINGSNPVCFHNGTSRHDGETWNLNQCTTCMCREGLTFCEPVQCEPLSQCSWIGTPDDQCCPICKGCVSQTGDLYVSGSTWQQDTCVTCYCEFGQVYCQAQFCSITCSSPRVIPGECCPVCEDDNIAMVTLAPHCPLLSHCLLMCIDGYVRGKDGCYQCQCLELTDEPCDLECPNGYRLDLMGIEVCDCADPAPYFPKHRSTSLIPSIPTDVDTPTSTTEIVSSSTTLLASSTTPLPPAESTCPALIGCDRQCLYGYKNNKLGCLRCRCNKCPPFECAKKCRDGYMLNSDGCKLCKCLDSGFLDLPHSTAVPFQPVRGRRCFSVDGQLMDDGQTWWDGCRKCLCFQGHEMCELMTCPALRCPNPVMKFGNCCLTCPGISPSKSLLVSSSMCHTNNGRYVVEGETWMMDECTQCICHQGAALCAIDSCPPLLCSYPVMLTHVCCPVCPSYKDGVVQATSNNSCLSIAGTEYSHGDVWKVSACQSCTCRDGQIHCFSQTCPLLNCKKTLLKKGHCCPVCLDGLAQYCVYNFDTYDNGESWLVDDCTTCACIDAQVVCTIKVCDLPQCASPIQVPGSCCFSCSNSTTTGQGLSNGTSIERGNPDNSADVNINTRVIVPLIVVIVILVVLVGVMLFVLICIMPKRNVVIVHKSQPELQASTKIFAGSFVQDNSCCVSTSIYEMPIPMSNSLATDSTKLSSDSLKLSLLNNTRTAASDSSFQKSQSECSPFTNTNEGAALHEEQKLLYDNYSDANKADDERSGKADAPPARWNRYSVYLDADLRSHLLKASPNASVSNNRKSW